MPSFVPDIVVRVHTPEGRTEEVDTQRDVEGATFLDSLRGPFNLRSKDAQGRHVQWHIYDRNNEKLDLGKTLAENGIDKGHDLYLRESERDAPAKSEVHGPDGPQPSRHAGERVLIRCDNAHYYDPRKYSSCPYCEERKRKG
jgi:hypothetical protein